MLRRLAIAAALLLLVALVAGAWVWNQATALPDWAEEEPPTALVDPQGAHGPGAPADPDDVAPPPLRWSVPEAGGSPADPPAQAAPKKSRKRELRNFHLHAADRNRVIRKAVRTSRATYEDGKLEAGVVIVPGEIDVKSMPAKDRALVQRALRSFPGLKGKRVYVALEDEPKVVKGVLQLGPDTQIRVGELRYPLSAFARKLGVSAAEIRKQVNRELRRLDARPPQD